MRTDSLPILGNRSRSPVVTHSAVRLPFVCIESIFQRHRAVSKGGVGVDAGPDPAAT